jgi:hypothetical protein
MKKSLPLLFLVVIIAALAWYFSSDRSPLTTSVKANTNFEIKDTSQVGKIFIADLNGRSINLKRQENGTWTVNDKYRAREDAVLTLLKTFKNVYVQRPVPKEAQEEVNKVMAGASKKVEIYNREGEWLKTWYVGHATMDKKGTYMLLETPEYGKATEPFIMDMKGFIGMLNTRFFTNEDEWRSVGIVRYPDMNFNKLEVDYPSNPEQSFKVELAGGNDILLYDGEGQKIAQFDTLLLKDYLLNYKVLSFENYRTGLSDFQADSVKNATPYQIITITDPKKTTTISVWPKKAPPGQMEMDNETPAVIDRERVYAATQEGQLALAQRFMFDKFRAPLQAFTD